MFGILIWTIIVCYVYYLWHVYSYWRRRGVCGPNPLPFIGNYGPVLFQTMNQSQFMTKLYKEYPNEKLIGIYRGLQPVLLVRDIELFKYFLIQDNQSFLRILPELPKQIIKKDAIIVLRAPLLKQPVEGILYKRRVYENLLSYLQSTAMKNYLNHIDELVKKKAKFNVNTLHYKFILDMTSAMIFGKNINTFQNDSDYEKAVNYITENMFKKTRTTQVLSTYPLLFSIFTKFAYSTTAFNKLANIVKKVLNENQNIGEDPTTIVEHLLQLQGKQFTSPRSGSILDVDNKFIVQFITTLSYAGISAVSRSLTFMFYELAMNQDIQNKVYEEVSQVMRKHNGKLSVNTLYEMKYSEMVIKETLRLHPGDEGLTRKSVGPYNIPGTKVTIDEQTTVYLLRNCVHQDPQYFANAEVFDPENFSPTNKLKIPRMAYLPFGAGHKICVGNYSFETKNLVVCKIKSLYFRYVLNIMYIL